MNLNEQAEDLYRGAKSKERDIDNYLDSVRDALRDLEGTVIEAENLLEKAVDALEAGEIDQDEFDDIEGSVGDIQDRLCDARQAVRNVL